MKSAKSKKCASKAPESAPGAPTATLRQLRKVDLVLEPECFQEEMARVSLQEVEIGGRILRPGSRVRLHPREGCDLLDTALAGRSAVIEGIDEDDTGAAHVAVIVDDDPGRALGRTRHPAHRFFFAPGELEPIEQGPGSATRRRVLVAGIGNLFLGDDGFGAVVAQRLLKREQTVGVDVVDFGIRGMDLAYALGQDYHAAILVDALPGGGVPGVLVVMEAQTDGQAAPNLDGHRMDPLSVLRIARSLGPLPGQILIVGCRPQEISEEWNLETAMILSTPVAAAVEKAADLVEQLAAQLVAAPCLQTQPQ
jgi:hydrogenase maturation protease